MLFSTDIRMKSWRYSVVFFLKLWLSSFHKKKCFSAEYTNVRKPLKLLIYQNIFVQRITFSIYNITFLFHPLHFLHRIMFLFCHMTFSFHNITFLFCHITFLFCHITFYFITLHFSFHHITFYLITIMFTNQTTKKTKIFCTLQHFHFWNKFSSKYIITYPYLNLTNYLLNICIYHERMLYIK